MGLGALVVRGVLTNTATELGSPNLIKESRMADPNYSSLPPFTKQLIEETVQAVIKELEKSNLFPESLFDTPQTAQYLNTSASLLSLLRAKDKGPPYVQIESAIRYRRSDIDNWLGHLVIRPRKSI